MKLFTIGRGQQTKVVEKIKRKLVERRRRKQSASRELRTSFVLTSCFSSALFEDTMSSELNYPSHGHRSDKGLAAAEATVGQHMLLTDAILIGRTGVHSQVIPSLGHAIACRLVASRPSLISSTQWDMLCTHHLDLIPRPLPPRPPPADLKISL